ncbi:2,3-diaminopropionate biosynthesis protein SbnA [Longimicrobium terrae]|uniref:N-(2-amino-2-carboxyethyl)-L-glutamate synthase n=1 Tax=Longimicrobium terrae TaxID=1639882 RepID=A0A841GVJ6_9BACT|nr:2,3-diaminopropionate biosynthesis protein SbnA [Longimicrobium terrae]MBB4635070.1 cysteine synthase A [Longimicrobium terrae]MBB6069464.1 cysteine synthase A [Longimicrobium terrae]NNC31733.1 2,3-diaminopropionate biosynthesis protein SbnA [Longimicrobium terrae]
MSSHSRRAPAGAAASAKPFFDLPAEVAFRSVSAAAAGFPSLDEGVLCAVGHTPLVSLRGVGQGRLRVYAKLEGLNPGGSAKDRPALNIIRAGIAAGQVRPGTVVVESSSGNMGVGLAQACSYLGLRFVCVVDPRTTTQNIQLLRAYGAAVEVVEHPDPETGEFLHARIRRVREILESVPSGFWPDQFNHEANAAAHRDGTMREIAAELEGAVDYVFCATSTCGTLRGCADYLRETGLDTRLVAVDALGSVIFGGPHAERIIPGLGSGMVPGLLRPGLAHAQVHVTNLDCVAGCRRAALREALLVGGSSGGVYTAFERMQDELPDGSVCVLVFCDRGERYLDTVFSDTWVQERFGDVAHLWQTDDERLPAWT